MSKGHNAMRASTHHLRHHYYEHHYSPVKLAFQNTMRAGDQKLMIDLEWPNHNAATAQVCEMI